jgi:hypothetical protein
MLYRSKFPLLQFSDGAGTAALGRACLQKPQNLVSDGKFDQTPPELRANILDFYSDLSAPIETKKNQVR